MTNSFVKRRIEVIFTLGPVQNMVTGATTQPTFGTTGQDTLTLSGLRCSAAIVKSGAGAMAQLQLRVFGMPLSLMNELSVLGAVPTATKNNTVSVFAGDDSTGMGLVYTGTVSQAWADMKAAPQAVFEVQAFTLFYQALAPAPPTSFRGPVDVATVLSGLANAMGLAFENNGVSGIMLSNPYLPGTARDQAMRAVQQAGIEWNGGDGRVLAIWPRGSARGGVAPVLTPETGLVGFPAYTGFGVSATVLFNPSIVAGGLVTIKNSGITPADGTWAIYRLAHSLESETPNGAWFTQIEATAPGNVVLSR